MPSLVALFLALATAPSAIFPVAAPALVERQGQVMGTRWTMAVEAADRAAALAAAEAALRALEATAARLSTWTSTSELARLNAAPVGAPVALSAVLAAELTAAAECTRTTAGGFDAGVGALVDAWGLRHGGRAPGAAELAAARAASGMRLLELTGGVEGTFALRRHAGLRLEEGGFGKGAGLDRAVEALAAAGARGWIDLGGQVAVHGAERLVAIADPRSRQRAAVAVRLAGGSLATSGNGERAVVVAGQRRGHLLDPRSGEPAADFGSLSVWAPSALAADCLATGLYVHGPREALRRAAALPDVEALVLVPGPGGRLRAAATAGLAGRLAPLAPEVDVVAPSEVDVGDRDLDHRAPKEREQEAVDA